MANTITLKFSPEELKPIIAQYFNLYEDEVTISDFDEFELKKIMLEFIEKGMKR